MERSEFSCPRDGQALADLPAHPGGSICPACGGIHLRDAAIQGALSAEGVELAKTRSLYHLPAPLPCPGCRAAMQGLLLAGIEIDVCRECRAVWLDKGELEKADAYLRADLPRRHPKSGASADDFGVFGSIPEMVDQAPWPFDLEIESEMAREIRDALKRLFGR